jgi:hypothetical protein
MFWIFHGTSNNAKDIRLAPTTNRKASHLTVFCLVSSEQDNDCFRYGCNIVEFRSDNTCFLSSAFAVNFKTMPRKSWDWVSR